jgi:hypothetical protein
MPTPIFRMDDVSRALTINDRQLMQLNTMTQQLQQKYQAQYDRLASGPERDRNNRLMELNREYANAWLNGAKDHLDANQLSRYQQLHLQYGGFSTFNDPAIQKGLNLTDAQLAQLNEALLWSNAQTQDISRQAQTDPTRARQAYADYAKAYQDRLNKSLTAEQQRLWSQMTGDPFPFAPPFGTAGTTPPKK